MEKIWDFLKELAEPIANNWSEHPEAAIISTVLVISTCWIWHRSKGIPPIKLAGFGIAAWFVLVACLGTVISFLQKSYERYEEQPIFFVAWTVVIIAVWIAVRKFSNQQKARGLLVILWIVGIFFLVPFLNQSISVVKLFAKDKEHSNVVTTNMVTMTNMVKVYATNTITVTNYVFCCDERDDSEYQHASLSTLKLPAEDSTRDIFPSASGVQAKVLAQVLGDYHLRFRGFD